jgi:hypothetical protein
MACSRTFTLVEGVRRARRVGTCGTCTGIQGCEAEVDYALGSRGCHGVNTEACVVAQGV